MLSLSEVADFARAQGIAGATLCFHASFKSFGRVEGGPRTIVEGFVGADCTLLSPAFYYDSVTLPPPGAWYDRNGLPPGGGDWHPGVSYEGRGDQIDVSMGVIPRTMIEFPGAIRSDNPLNGFVAIGPRAGELAVAADAASGGGGVACYEAYPGYRRLYEAGEPAFIVLAGVGLTRCTPGHYAEQVAGKVLFRRWAIHRGTIVEVEVGSCSEGFDKLDSKVASLERVAMLGESRVRIYPFAAFVESSARAIAEEPNLLACGEADCLRCKDMAAGGRHHLDRDDQPGLPRQSRE